MLKHTRYLGNELYRFMTWQEKLAPFLEGKKPKEIIEEFLGDDEIYAATHCVCKTPTIEEGSTKCVVCNLSILKLNR